jgi:hypothetical protein
MTTNSAILFSKICKAETAYLKYVNIKVGRTSILAKESKEMGSGI